ncbi:hypothetical protein MNBD_GAMMA11-1938 [hydrothermal vent metagenome]|uniref:DUF2956 domain-containing protein n=1 Tax=hydrothermal vent metagenome TaxID=652676 RepID=A0A3B0X673_9ZZZZ
MSRHARTGNGSEKTKEEAMKIARGMQKPGQTKEQTKLIYQGIQKGIEQFKKEQGKKNRETSKKLKKSKKRGASLVPVDDDVVQDEAEQSRLAWVLLILSWVLFVVYIVLSR